MQNTNFKEPATDVQKEKLCAICGKPSKPFGYIRHGAGHVCSKKCDAEYHDNRFNRSES